MERMRLNKYIAEAGIASRRKADELIRNGNVKLNGRVVTEMGITAGDGDIVSVNGRVVEPCGRKLYYALNKPKGYICSVKDQFDRPTVLELIEDTGARLFPVGRLDYNTTGLILITNDGELSYRVTHPKTEVVKTYRALLAGILSDERAAKLRRGVDIGGFVTSRSELEIIRQSERRTLVDIKIHEGKNRQVRRMFEAVGNEVLELKRTAIGDIRLGKLAEGGYRKLSRAEIEYLKSL